LSQAAKKEEKEEAAKKEEKEEAAKKDQQVRPRLSANPECADENAYPLPVSPPGILCKHIALCISIFNVYVYMGIHFDISIYTKI
jgi:hypothetical protein